jgi:hypothetical protein
MKKMLIAMTLALAIGATASQAFAWGGGCGWGSGYGNPGPAAYNSADYQRFEKETASLRNSLAADQAEYAALMQQANPDPAKARAVVERIIQKETELRTKARELNLASGSGPWMGGPMMGGPMMGGSMMGYGHNHGYGGFCW